MILARAKSIAIAVLGFLAAVFAALMYRGKAKHEKARRKGIEEAREVEHEAMDRLSEGLQEEQEAQGEVDTTDRNHFS